MALIIDPDFLNQSTEVVFDAAAKTVQLLKAGNLSDDGVTLQALYSFAKEEWKSDPTLIRHPFCLTPITPESFEFINGWAPADQTTIDLIRNAGFAVKAGDGSSLLEYAGIITLGDLGAGDQVYYQQVDGGAAVDVVLTGPVNQCVKVYDYNSGSPVDNRGFFKIFAREYQKQYAQAELSDIGVSQLNYQAYRFPLANAADLVVTQDDTTSDAFGVTITYGATTQNIGGTDYDFNVTIDANNRTLEEAYMAVQSALRKNSDIDAGAGDVTGKTADELLSFVGSTINTAPGVFIENFLAVDTNRQDLYDVNGTLVQYPYIAAGTITFNQNLVDDGSAEYFLFYSDNYDTTSAEIVLDAQDNEIKGTISGGSVSFSYDYDGDSAGGGAAIDKPVTLVAIGLDSAQYVSVSGTITRTTTNQLGLVAALERNYENPA